MHLPGAKILNMCTRPPKCAHRVQGAPLISDNENICTLQPKCAHQVQGAPLISNTDYIVIIL